VDVPDLLTLHLRRGVKWSEQDADVVSSTVAEMDFPLAEPITAALEEAIARHDVGYAPTHGSALPEALAGFAARRLGWTIDPAQVTLVPDVMRGLVELTRVLAAPDRPVAFTTPAYPPFFADLLEATSRLLPIPVLADGAMDLDALSDALSSGLRVLVLANPHNPSGRVAPRAELAAIAELAAAAGAWVLADEIHAPLVLPGAVHTPWLEVSDAARACGIVLTSASKAFNLAGLKAAMIVTASEPARAVVARMPPAIQKGVGILGVVAAEAALTAGDEWLDAVVAQLDVNRALLGEQLRTYLPGVSWTPPAATYLAWLDCRDLGLGADPAAAFLAKGRVALGSGPAYRADGFVRLNFGTSAEMVSEIVRRMTLAGKGA
jgi:cystathionine beta-lyase